MQKRFLSLVVLLVMALAAMAQVTTSGISGKVTSQGEEVIGASVTATHIPSGTIYRAVTNVQGRYTIQGMRAGGPYKVEITYVGHQPKVFADVNLLLGESQNLSCSLEEDSKVLEELVVTGKRGLNATKTGAAQSINAQMINDIPTVTHSIADIARLNPQISVNAQSGSMSFAGTNNRYNSFMIDGAMNNDVFGLASNGSNGGQAGAQPVSMETIDQIQINVAPFDVRQGGFTGGAINAITKSGTNVFHGSVYGYGNNESLLGKKYRLPDGSYSSAYEDESEYQAGFTLGGPIVKDKLFFFANYERSNKEYDNLYGPGAPASKVDMNTANDILNKVKDLANRQGYDYSRGAYSGEGKYIKSNKAGLKLDWNINDFNKLSLRWSYVDAKQLMGLGGISSMNTEDHLYNFKSQTNSFIAELQSRLSPVLSNEARASYVRVRDKRTSGAPFPSITISGVPSLRDQDGKTTNTSINIGNEISSMANGLDQDIITIEDNLTWYKGNHTLTAGTHNEIYQFRNLYIQYLYGSYSFNSLDNFNNYYLSAMDGRPDGSLLNSYRYQQANVSITGDPRWAAEFGAAQLGFYLQDKWDATNNFSLTYGLRMDLPIFFDEPAENKGFNDYADSMGWKYRTNQKISSTPMWSPRVGFRWDIHNDRRYILRGGMGIFTGRIPFVWLSNNFSNTGVQLSNYQTSKKSELSTIAMYLDPDQQYRNAEILTETAGSQLINVYDKKFKFSQTFRANLGFDFELLGINWTAEAIYSKTLNDVYYKNLAYDQTGKTFGQVYGYMWDNRPMYDRVTTGTPYGNIYVLQNTNKGYTYSLSLQAEKHFDFGLDLNASYTFTQSKAVASVTSSVAASNWTNTQTYRDPNNPELANSAYNHPHNVKGSAFYHISYGPKKMFTTTIGLIYQGYSGSPYSLRLSSDCNGDGTYNDLMFIPTDEQVDKMVFVATSNFTAEQQRENFKTWLANTPYLRDHRGEFYKRYADNLRFESHFDFHLAEKIGVKVGKQIHALEISLDIMNVANLLNKDWGRTYSTSYDSEFMSPLTYSGGGEYQFAVDSNYVLKYPNDYYSRCRGQIGLKYTF